MNTYNCPKCNTEFEKGTKFCTCCGYYLELLKCVKCGKAYPAGINFCPDDGGAVIPEAFRYGSTQNQLRNASGIYPKATIGYRFLALLIDRFIAYGLAVPAALFYVIGIAQYENHDGSAISVVLIVFAVLLFFIPLTYRFIKDGLGKGQSWGKRAFGLMVVHLPTNTPCTKGQSCLRALISIILNIVPFVGWLIEPIMVLATADGRRLADKIANTQVIEARLFNN